MERDRDNTDWIGVENYAIGIISYINGMGINVDNIIYNFFEDADAREKSKIYSENQTRKVLDYLKYSDSL